MRVANRHHKAVNYGQVWSHVQVREVILQVWETMPTAPVCFSSSNTSDMTYGVILDYPSLMKFKRLTQSLHHFKYTPIPIHSKYITIMYFKYWIISCRFCDIIFEKGTMAKKHSYVDKKNWRQILVSWESWQFVTFCHKLQYEDAHTCDVIESLHVTLSALLKSCSTERNHKKAQVQHTMCSWSRYACWSEDNIMNLADGYPIHHHDM